MNTRAPDRANKETWLHISLGPLWHCLKGPSAIQKALSVTRRLNNQSITDFKKKLSKAGSMLDENLCEKVNGSHRLSISHWSLVPPTATRSLSISCLYGHSRTKNISKRIYVSITLYHIRILIINCIAIKRPISSENVQNIDHIVM